VRGSLSAGATIDALHIAFAAPAARHEWRARLTGEKAQHAMRASAGRVDAAAVAGAVPPYVIPNLAVDHLPVDTALPSGRWRGDADSYTVFAIESFVDEMAGVAGVEPFSFRMGMLGNAPELARCLQSATALGGWSGGIAGSGQGIACCSLRGSHIAVMAVARPGSAGLIVERLVAAVDVGRVLNPGLVRQQVECGLMFGLAAAVGVTTRYRRGLAQARRLAEIGLPDLARSPVIDVEILESDRDPGGVEELGVPPVAPALANALYTVTSQRIRRLPLSTKALP
jgi:isoquinoline 1-oxidoreductase beta subunit